ncbi:MAG: membrane protein insertion efficiency factor YidD [Armatimonadetes bacterium]|nr:membrane protein insertion efficiency factor YidD [Armatimonadota bacterium]
MRACSSAPSPGLTARLAIALVRFYQCFLSCLKPPTCRFYPTCSEYGLHAITNCGLIRGGLLAAWRLLRCNPFSAGGYDPGPWATDVTHGQCDTAESLPQRRGSEGPA